MADDNDDLQKQIDELKKSNEALAKKNEELLGETKAAKEARRAAEKEKADAEEAARAKEQEASEKSGDVEALKKQLEEKHAKDMESLTSERDGLQSQLSKLVIDGGVKAALTKAEVAPSLIDGAALVFKNSAEIEMKDGEAFAGGKPLADAVKEWAESESGSAYKAASKSDGGGAPGGGKNGAGPAAKRSEMNPLTKAEYIKQHGQEAYAKLPE